ncbi:hypothetical protein QBC44DRAFT_400961 [Cladorrhinum sp. PSN332]|nr:hypothetical protein QBC44DRAFT_400961 [Cladorrhinum sp. PSN332]
MPMTASLRATALDRSSPHHQPQRSKPTLTDAMSTQPGRLDSQLTGTEQFESCPRSVLSDQPEPFELEGHGLGPSAMNSNEGLVPTQSSNEFPVKPLWKTWMLEILCIIGGLAVFTTIIIVLALFDQKELPNWPLRISLNTVLAFLAIVAKAAFMMPVSAAISQTQWSWFSRERPLYDFHLVDQASRGPLGSAKLALRVRHRHLITLGAMLTIVSVLTSPITQLAINYPVRQVQHHGEARLSGLRRLNHSMDIAEFPASNGVVQSTLRSNSNHTAHPIIPPGAVCSTGNCTFDQYSTLGVCVQMANVTSLLVVQGFDMPEDEQAVNMTEIGELPYYVTLFPNARLWKVSVQGADVGIVHQSRMAAVMGLLNGRQSVAFRDMPNLMQARLASFILIYTAASIEDETARAEILHSTDRTGMAIASAFGNLHHEAVEVIFYACVQTYNTTVDRGLERTEMVDSIAELAMGQDPDFHLDRNCTLALGDGQERSRMCYDHREQDWNRTLRLRDPTGKGDEFYTIDYRSMQMISTELYWAFSGAGWDSFSDPNRELPDLSTFTGFLSNTYTFLGDTLYGPANILNGTRLHQQLRTQFQNVVAAISHNLRDSSHNSPIQSAYNITGKAWTQESYVDISWGWIAYLGVELVLATVFLALTIFTQIKARHSQDKTSAGPMFHDYKDAAMAPLLALSSECRAAAGGGLQTRDEMERTAKRLLVKFEGNEVVVAGTLEGKEKA